MDEILGQEWRERVARRRFRASVAFDDDGLALGHGTVLLARGDQPAITLDLNAAHDRLLALLAVAGDGILAKDATRHLGAALDDWRRGDKALAAIRLAFARLPTLPDSDAAHRLFLAEQVLDAGLPPRELMRALGYTATIEPLLKSPGQAREPKGSGRISGRFKSSQSVGAPQPTPPTPPPPSPPEAPRALFVPVFLDTSHEHDTKPQLLPAPEPLGDAILDGRVLDATIPKGGSPVPVPSQSSPPPAKTEEDERNGSACPPMRPDRPNGANAKGDREEHHVAQIVNPESPTPKNTPETPNVVSQAYYLPRADGTEVTYDDCKRTNTPTPDIPDLRKGDMVEVKTVGAATLATIKGMKAEEYYNEQINRQSEAIRIEGKGRRLFTCVGSQANVVKFTEKYKDHYPEVRFVDCGGANR